MLMLSSFLHLHPPDSPPSPLVHSPLVTWVFDDDDGGDDNGDG